MFFFNGNFKFNTSGSVWVTDLQALYSGISGRRRNESMWPDRVAQSVAHLTEKPEVLGSIPDPATYFRFFFR